MEMQTPIFHENKCRLKQEFEIDLCKIMKALLQSEATSKEVEFISNEKPTKISIGVRN